MKEFIITLVIVSITLLLSPFVISFFLFRHHLVRNKKTKWIRECSSKNNAEQIQMWHKGLSYRDKYKNRIEEIEIVRENMHLYGELINNHSDKSVIILGGRCECLFYSYYYAKEYLDNNFNVIVIDTRAHGKSDGKYNTVGFKEAYDLKAWIRYLENKYGYHYFIIHGICIGGATTAHLASLNDCPDSVKKIFLEGTFRTFYEAYKYHMQKCKGPLWPTLDIIFTYFKLINKCDAKKDGPINWVKDIKVETLFLSGSKDTYVLPEFSKELYETCGSSKKKLVYLPKGNHSHLRINQEAEYDKIIKEFIND